MTSQGQAIHWAAANGRMDMLCLGYRCLQMWDPIVCPTRNCDGNPSVSSEINLEMVDVPIFPIS